MSIPLPLVTAFWPSASGLFHGPDARLDHPKHDGLGQHLAALAPPRLVAVGATEDCPTHSPHAPALFAAGFGRGRVLRRSGLDRGRVGAEHDGPPAGTDGRYYGRAARPVRSGRVHVAGHDA